jgi:hypothetical protein
MDFKEIIEKLKEPLMVLLGAFFIALLIMWGIFFAADQQGTTGVLMGITWANAFGYELTPTAWGVISIIILIVALAVGICFWYLRVIAKMEKPWLTPYIDYPLIALGGIFMEIILVTIFLKQIW